MTSVSVTAQQSNELDDQQGCDSQSFGSIMVIGKDGVEGKSFSILSDISMGRSKTCDIRIRNESVSRVHTRVEVDQNGRCFMYNVSQTNPTVCNGEPLQSAEGRLLYDGDLISLGDRTFKYCLGEAEPEVTANHTVTISRKPALETIGEENSGAYSPLVEQHGSLKCNNSVRKSDKKATPEAKKKAGLKTPIRNAINAKRQSYGDRPEEAVVKATSTITTPTKVKTPVKTPIKAAGTRKALNTPLRRAIQNRQGHETTVTDDSRPSPGRVAMSVAFLAAINSRRRSYSPGATVKVHTPARKLLRRLATPLREAVEKRRQSFSSAAAEGSGTPRRQSTQARPLKSSKKTKNNQSPASSTSRALVLLGSAPKTPKQKQTQMDEMETREVEDVTMNIDYSGGMVNAMCAQISTDSMAMELKMQGFPDELAYSEAKVAFLASTPGRISTKVNNKAKQDKQQQKGDVVVDDDDFCLFDEIISPVRRAANTPKTRKSTTTKKRGRKSLLRSLEKQGEEASVTAKTEHMLIVCDLIDSFNDAEMATINKYALQLENCGLECDEAYAISLDAYVRGIERGNIISPFSPITKVEKVVAAAAADTAKDAEEECESAFSSLQSLYNVPAVAGGKANENDRQLVERYAELIVEDTHVDDSFAFGVALDTFLADPLEFRERISNLIISLREAQRCPFTPVSLPQQNEQSDDDDDDDDEMWAPEDYVMRQPSPDATLTLPSNRFVVVTKSPAATAATASTVAYDSSSSTKSKNKSSVVKAKTPSTAMRKDVAMSFIAQTLQDVITEIASAGSSISIADLSLSKYSSKSPRRSSCGSSTSPSPSSGPCTMDAGVEYATGAIQEIITELAVAEASKVTTPTTRTPAKRSLLSSHKSSKKKLPPSAAKRHAVAERCVAVAFADVMEGLIHKEQTASTASTPTTSPAKVTKCAFKPSATKRREIASTYVSDALQAVMADLIIAKHAENAAGGRKPVLSPSSVKMTRASTSTPVSAQERRSPRKAKTIKSPSPVASKQASNSNSVMTKVTINVTASPSQPTSKRARKAAVAVPSNKKEEPVVPTRSKRTASTAAAAAQTTPLKPAPKRTRKAAVSALPSPVVSDSEESAMAILCDGCDGEFFCDEIGLSEVPAGDWFCAACTKKRVQSKKKPVAKKTTKAAPKSKTRPAAARAQVESAPRRSTRGIR